MIHPRDVTELANICIHQMQISCAKSVRCGCGFVAQSKLLAIVRFVATVIQVIQLSYLKLSRSNTSFFVHFAKKYKVNNRLE